MPPERIFNIVNKNNNAYANILAFATTINNFYNAIIFDTV